MGNDERNNLILKYINGDLIGNELANFMQQMQNDPELREDIEVSAYMNAEYNVTKKTQFKSLVKEYGLSPDPSATENINATPLKIEKQATTQQKQKQKEIPKISWYNNPLLKVAASVLLFALVGLLVFNNLPESSPTQLADSYLTEHYAAPSVTMGDNVDELWQKAISAYKSDDFVKSATLLEDIVTKKQAKEEHLYYLGLSYLYQNPSKANKAIANLSKVNGKYYGEAAQWYKSLALIKLDKVSDAKQILQKLVKSSDAQRKSNAQILINSLN